MLASLASGCARTEQVPVEQPVVSEPSEPGPERSEEREPDRQIYRLDDGSTEAAIAAFERAWASVVLPALQVDRPQSASAWVRILALDTSSRNAYRVECRGAFVDLEDAWGLTENTYYGGRENLDREGDCWVVRVSEGFETLDTYMVPNSDQLLLVWSIPEG